MSDYFIADDLSGALDAAAAFHHAGRAVRIVLAPEAWSAAAPDEVVGITTETRNVPPEVAAETVRCVLELAKARGGRLLYKKIDSTLRGSVAAELEALQAALPGTWILFCPANPAARRIVRDGVLRVDGVPVAETEFARDPTSPVRESEIRRLLGRAATDRVTIADAETENGLAAAVTRMDSSAGEWVAVGSGALARPVAARLARQGATLKPWASAELPAGPILVVCGSAHPRNREQAEQLRSERGVEIVELDFDAPRAAQSAALANLRRSGGCAVLVSQRRVDSARVLRSIADVVEHCVREGGVRRLFVTGGETAFACGGKLGLAALQFEQEVEAGLSVSHGATRAGVMRFAIKPGGFGDARTWVRAWDALRAAG